MSTDPAIEKIIQPLQLKQRLIQPYRTKRTTPRTDLSGYAPDAWQIWTDPAPRWVVRTVDTILEYSGSLLDDGEELARRYLLWVGKEGADHKARSKQIAVLAALWVGPRLPMLETFIRNAEKTKSGRRIGIHSTPDEVEGIPTDEECKAILQEAFDRAGTEEEATAWNFEPKWTAGGAAVRDATLRAVSMGGEWVTKTELTSDDVAREVAQVFYACGPFEEPDAEYITAYREALAVGFRAIDRLRDAAKDAEAVK